MKKIEDFINTLSKYNSSEIKRIKNWNGKFAWVVFVHKNGVTNIHFSNNFNYDASSNYNQPFIQKKWPTEQVQEYLLKLEAK